MTFVVFCYLMDICVSCSRSWKCTKDRCA